MPMFDITTGTGDFIANGVVSHNCYARPSHAYLELSPGLDFETRLFAKANAAPLLREELSRPGYRCDPITIGPNTDPYQPIEREWKITRQVLEVLAEHDHPCSIVTKNALVLRELDLLEPMAAKNLVRVFVSVTTLDHEIARKIGAGFIPRENSFHYPLFLMFIDLGELDTVTAGSRFWSIDSMNLAYLRRRDHFGDPQISIDQSVRDLVKQRTGKRPEGPVRMLCHFRYFGHCFNPASFYFCYDTQGVRVETIIIEVHNTPWGEVFLYVLDESLNSGKDNWKQYSFDKKFHVSPFTGMDMHYDWRFCEPGSELNIHINSYHKGEKYFDATLTLKRQEISGRTLNRMLVEYPFVTVKVIAMIYWFSHSGVCRHGDNSIAHEPRFRLPDRFKAALFSIAHVIQSIGEIVGILQIQGDTFHDPFPPDNNVAKK